MKEETPKGLSSLRSAFIHDLEARWRSKEELEAKLQWVLGRADKYAAFCGVTRDEVLTAWENKRDSWWFSYYADHKQPDPRSLTGYPVLRYQDWVARGKELYGPDMLDWQFVCPACGHVQTLREFHEVGIDPDYGVANCASRFGIGGSPTCKWTTGGLLRLGGYYVINPNYIPQLIFAFAADKPADRKTLVPGDIVQIRGVEGPLNGKSGEVVKVNEEGSVEVKVALMELTARNEVTAAVSTVVLRPENLIYDAEVTEKIRQGKGGVIIR